MQLQTGKIDVKYTQSKYKRAASKGAYSILRLSEISKL